MNSNIVKTEKFGHLHLVYHFTSPLTDYELRWKNSTLLYWLIATTIIQYHISWIFDEKLLFSQLCSFLSATALSRNISY